LSAAVASWPARSVVQVDGREVDPSPPFWAWVHRVNAACVGNDGDVNQIGKRLRQKVPSLIVVAAVLWIVVMVVLISRTART
jgi:hypothetical protein